MGLWKSMIEVKNRPLSVTIVCVVGFAGFAVLTWMLFTPRVIINLLRQFDFFFLYGAMVINLIGACGLVGYWMMRKWGVYFYGAMFVLSLGLGLFYVLPQMYMSHVAPLLVLLTGLRYFKRMS